MPTYEYECRTCGFSFEKTQSMSEEPLKECPECGKSVRRVINGGAGIIFKGSGFYVTDSKGKGSTAATGQKPSSPAGTTASGETSSGTESGKTKAEPGSAPASGKGSQPASVTSSSGTKTGAGAGTRESA